MLGLVLVVVCIAAVSFGLFSARAQLTALRSTDREDVAWLASQVELEHYHYQRALRVASVQAGPVGDDLDREIRRGVILISRDLRADEAHSVLLEELVQSMGLRWDIRDPAYRGRSIFDEDSNLVRRLSGQDRTALRMHYGTRR